MVAGVVDDSSSSLKYARLTRLDPSKEEQFRAWSLQLKTALSTSANSALELGKPTRNMAALIAPKGSTQDMITELYAELWQNYLSSQEEVWRAIVQYTDFVGSPQGRACMETLDRMFGTSHDGMAAFEWMHNRYDNKVSFTKQTALSSQLSAESLRERLFNVYSPESASDVLNLLYSTVWLQIRDNDPSNPFDFIRRVLHCMRSMSGEVSTLGFTHQIRLDSKLGSLDHSNADSYRQAMSGTLDEVYYDADKFISAISYSWPTTTKPKALITQQGGGPLPR